MISTTLFLGQQDCLNPSAFSSCRTAPLPCHRRAVLSSHFGSSHVFKTSDRSNNTCETFFYHCDNLLSAFGRFSDTAELTSLVDSHPLSPLGDLRSDSPLEVVDTGRVGAAGGEGGVDGTVLAELGLWEERRRSAGARLEKRSEREDLRFRERDYRPRPRSLRR